MPHEKHYLKNQKRARQTTNYENGYNKKKLWEEILMHTSKMLLSIWSVNKNYKLINVQFSDPLLCIISTSSDL